MKKESEEKLTSLPYMKNEERERGESGSSQSVIATIHRWKGSSLILWGFGILTDLHTMMMMMVYTQFTY